MNLYYRAWYHTLRAVAPTLAYIKVRGREHIPAKGPCLLVGNHVSMTDPPVLMAYVPRHLHFMTKAELFDEFPWKYILPPGQPIVVHRGRADRQALRQAEEFLKQGQAVAIYAEGTRARSGEAQEARAGVVFLAQRTNAPIVPVAISGTEKLFSKRFPWYRRARVELTFGEPFLLSDIGTITRTNRDAIAQQVMARVAELLPPGYRGIYEARPLPGSMVGAPALEDEPAAETRPALSDRAGVAVEDER
jgi:1-acyl-sn-glycerol-3-phosphate acyltransferase